MMQEARMPRVTKGNEEVEDVSLRDKVISR